MEENNVIVVSSAESLNAINKAEIDIQIATAKNYPRNLKKVMSDVRAFATMDQETASECFYELKRGSGSDSKEISGLSVRFAEILVASWGNMRVQTRIIGNDGRQITAQGVCHDLETNVAVSVEVKRRITDKQGRTYSEDMQVVTGNAASAIAYRNAVLKVIPKAVTKTVINEVRQLAIEGLAEDFSKKLNATLTWFANRKVSTDALLTYVEADCIEAIDSEKLLTLRSLCNAINEGTTTIEETFFPKKSDSAEYAKQMQAKAGPTSAERARQASARSVKK